MSKIQEKLNDRFNSLMDTIRNNPWKTFFLLVIVFLSFGLKLHELNTGLQHEFPGSDPYSTAQNAVDVIDGKTSVNNFANPLPSIYLIFVYLIFGKHLWLAKFIQILASFAIPFFLYYVTKKYFGGTAGYIAALLSLLHPAIIFYSAHVWSEFWVIFLLCALLYIFVRVHADGKFTKTNFFLIGLFSGIASLGKIWVALIGAVLTLILLFHKFEKKQIASFLKKVLFFGGSALVGILLFLVPWIIYTSVNSGYFVFVNSNSGINLYIGNNPEGEIAFTSKNYNWDYLNEINITEGNCGYLLTNVSGQTSNADHHEYLGKCGGKYASQYILDNPGKFIKKMTTFTFKYWLFPNLEFYQRYIITPKLLKTTLWIFWILAFIGFLVSLSKWKMFIPFYAIMIIIWFFSGMAFYLARYKAGLAPVSIILASGGLYTLLYFINGKK